MIIVDDFNSRRVLRTITIELPEPEDIVRTDIASTMYRFASLYENMFPFFLNMILHHDITIYRTEKPFYHQSLVYFYEIAAHLTEPITRQYGNGDVNIIQSQFLTVIEGFINDCYVARKDFIKPIVTVYHHQADKFNLTHSTVLR